MTGKSEDKNVLVWLGLLGKYSIANQRDESQEIWGE